MCIPPSQYFKKSIANDNRFAVLPPYAEAVKHDVKGGSSSSSSHGCHFIYLLASSVLSWQHCCPVTDLFLRLYLKLELLPKIGVSVETIMSPKNMAMYRIYRKNSASE